MASSPQMDIGPLQLNQCEWQAEMTLYLNKLIKFFNKEKFDWNVSKTKVTVGSWQYRRQIALCFNLT